MPFAIVTRLAFRHLAPCALKQPSPRTLYTPLCIPAFSHFARTMATEAARSSDFATIDLSEYDPEQSKLMDERCIVVDENDRAIGALDKKTCELCYPLTLQQLTFSSQAIS
jgi:hypothetical protein